MKVLLSAFCGFILCSLIVASPTFIQPRHHLLGAKECTWGPSYWCTNITTAKGCNAVPHCIQAVWEKQRVPEDNDSICKICLDMVQQARDQLESNETQLDLKAVFEGSCKLIPLKPVRKECIKLADDFVPELVDALASQMNPQMVCSVAGLCNNARIDKMLAEQPLDKDPSGSMIFDIEPRNDEFTCDKCNKISTLMSAKFQLTDRDTVLENLLMICGRLSSFSDSCSSLVLLNFNEIYNHLEQSITPDTICHMSGVCTSKYHHHDGEEPAIEIETKSDIGVVAKRDDIPCELCEQLVTHLRDLLIANTTESEFKSVLEGLCNQTKGFRTECLSLVGEYYDAIYQTLTHSLDAEGMCFMIGICPKGGEDKTSFVPAMPALPVNKLEVTITEKPKRKLLGADEPKYTQQEIQSFQLPIDRLEITPGRFVGNLEGSDEGNNQLCTMCELFLHFVQDALADQKNEEKIKEVVARSCKKMPEGIQKECVEFVNTYGDALCALLTQEFDPREVCPMLHLCPKPSNIHVTIINHSKPSHKTECPLCLLAVADAQSVIQSNKSKENIRRTLHGLCTHLSSKLRMECDDFIDTYSDQLVELLAKDFTPEQICTQLKLCSESGDDDVDKILTSLTDDSDSNEIPDATVNGQFVPIGETDSTPNCMLCQAIVKEVEKHVINHNSKEQIKEALEHACDKMHKLRGKCEQFVEKHGDQIADLIMHELTPKEICHQMQLCMTSGETLQELERYIYTKQPTESDETVDMIMSATSEESIEDMSSEEETTESPKSDCIICKLLVRDAVRHSIRNKSQEEIRRVLQQSCSDFRRAKPECRKFVQRFGDKISGQLARGDNPKKVCYMVRACSVEDELLHKEFPSEISLKDDTKVNEFGSTDSPCVLCEFVMVKLEQELNNKKTEDEIKRAVENICHKMPKTVANDCVKFVDQYSALIIKLLATVPPKEICTNLGMCKASLVEVFDVHRKLTREDLLDCAVCTSAAESLSNLQVGIEDDEVVLSEGCTRIPSKHHAKCQSILEPYGISLLNLIKRGELRSACAQIGMCFHNQYVSLADLE